jgi:hypothetical protein
MSAQAELDAMKERWLATVRALSVEQAQRACDAGRACAEALRLEARAEARGRAAERADMSAPLRAAQTVSPAQIEACARAAHEANRAYCIAAGDTSQPSWEEAPEWQRSSAVAGVEGVIAGNTSEQSHESWLAEKARTGWQYGPTKDPAAKLHPCCVPYADLPPAQKCKDAVFVAVVRAMAEALGVSWRSRP